MAKQPTFKLFRIVDRKTDKSFAGFYGMTPHYTLQGTFFRNPETIRRHLRSICHEWSTERRESGAWYFKRGNEIEGRYKDLYVECYSVLQLKMHTYEASQYLGKPA